MNVRHVFGNQRCEKPVGISINIWINNCTLRVYLENPIPQILIERITDWQDGDQTLSGWSKYDPNESDGNKFQNPCVFAKGLGLISMIDDIKII